MIRPVREDDFPAIAAITNHYITTTAIHFAYEPVTADELRASWRAHPDHPFVVVDDVLGYAKATRWRDRAAYAWTAEVGLYVAPDAHRRGLGAALYRELLAELGRRGFRSAVAGIVMPSDASVALHRKLGFELVGTFRDAGFKLDTWHDVAWYQKRLP